MPMDEILPSPGEGFGAWTRTKYELAEDPVHGEVIRPLREGPHEIVLYRPPLSANDDVHPGSHPAIDLLNILRGRQRRQIGSNLAEAFAHWEKCGTCKGCLEVKDRALAFANQWGLLGIWRLPVLGYRNLTKDRETQAFGDDLDDVRRRQEPLSLFVRAAGIFGENLRELEKEQSTSNSGAADFDGGVAENLARAFADPETPDFVRLREVFVMDPSVLRTWFEREKQGGSFEITDEQGNEVSLDKLHGYQDAALFVRALQFFVYEQDDPGKRQMVRRELPYRIAMAFQGKPLSDWAHYLPLFMGREPDPVAPSSYQAAIHDEGPRGPLIGTGLNHLLRDVGICVTRRGGQLAMYYTFPTLWHAVHMQAALWIARDRRPLLHCANLRCQRAYLRKREHGQRRLYCSDACREAVYRARRKARDSEPKGNRRWRLGT